MIRTRIRGAVVDERRHVYSRVYCKEMQEPTTHEMRSSVHPPPPALLSTDTRLGVFQQPASLPLRRTPSSDHTQFSSSDKLLRPARSLRVTRVLLYSQPAHRSPIAAPSQPHRQSHELPLRTHTHTHRTRIVYTIIKIIYINVKIITPRTCLLCTFSRTRLKSETLVYSLLLLSFIYNL